MLSTYNKKDTTVNNLSTLIIMSNFNAESFAKWLEDAFRHSRFKSYSELAEHAGLKRSTVSSLVSAKPQSATGKASQPRTETVISLAKSLGIDIDQALLKAGHAPINDGVMVDIGNKATVSLGTAGLTTEERNEIANELSLAYSVILERLKRKKEDMRIYLTGNFQGIPKDAHGGNLVVEPDSQEKLAEDFDLPQKTRLNRVKKTG